MPFPTGSPPPANNLSFDITFVYSLFKTFSIFYSDYSYLYTKHTYFQLSKL